MSTWVLFLQLCQLRASLNGDYRQKVSYKKATNTIDLSSQRVDFSFGFISLCSLNGYGSPTTNFPGKIPSGLDLPSDIAAEKHLERIASK